MDYVAAEREAQHEYTRSALLAHVRQHPQALLVVEEYDKLDCATRGLFRQLIDAPASANVSLERRGARDYLWELGLGRAGGRTRPCNGARCCECVPVAAGSAAQACGHARGRRAGPSSCWSPTPGMRSCTACWWRPATAPWCGARSGPPTLPPAPRRGGPGERAHEAPGISRAATRSPGQRRGAQVGMEAAQRALKDLVFDRWLGEDCEPRADTLKSVGLVDFFLPFLPLERRHLVSLFRSRLAARGAALRRAEGAELAWAPDVPDFLADRVRRPRCLGARAPRRPACCVARF